MPEILLFALLLLLTFGVLLLLLKPSRTEADVLRHLSDIGKSYGAESDLSSILKQDRLSAIPVLNQVLQVLPGSRQLCLLIVQAGQKWDVAAVLFGSLAGFLATVWATLRFVPSIPLCLLVGCAVGFAPYAALFAMRSVRFSKFEDALPGAIDLMSRALKAGHGVVAMIEMVADETAEPVSAEFRILFDQQNLGLPLREAILDLVNRVPIADVRLLATAILVQKETGGNLAEILDKTAFIMRERTRLRGQLRIYTAQGRVSGWILCLLPFAMFFLIGLVNPAYEKKLLTEPMGLHMVYGGLVMMSLGVFAIRKIVNIKV